VNRSRRRARPRARSAEPLTRGRRAREGRVTAIRREPGEPPRVAVFIDGARVFTLPESALETMGLSVGATFGGGEPVEEGRASDLVGAREAALRLLSVRARTRSELAQRLTRKGHAAAVVARVIDGLAAAGLVDDRAFAELWADERMRRRPVGRRRLSQELRLKGVPPRVADEVVDRAFGEHPERALALRAARSWARRSAAGARERERLFAMLVRRGFARSTAIEVVREVMGERDE